MFESWVIEDFGTTFLAYRILVHLSLVSLLKLRQEYTNGGLLWEALPKCIRSRLDMN